MIKVLLKYKTIITLFASSMKRKTEALFAGEH